MVQPRLTEASELLDRWPFLRKSERVARFERLPREQMDKFFLALDAKTQSELVLGLPEGVRRLYIRLLAPDDAADVIQEAPSRHREYLLELLDDMTRQDARALLAYREDVAGGLMNPRFARLRPNSSIDEAITYLRQQVSQV
ncbi:MAG: magnesium transporter, partial [Verrucomicrobia bacterium]|nr:magnesium transporter [Verrucomicrobiota bacterium]